MKIRPRDERAWKAHESENDDEWSVGKPSYEKPALILVVVGVLVALAIVSFAILYPYLEENYFGAAPVWHPFSGIFDSSGQFISESCSLSGLQPILGGIAGIGRIVPTSVVACGFHGGTYLGHFGTDCNTTPTGVIPSVNGTEIPYGGCVLSLAPLNITINGLFKVQSNGSMPIYVNQKIVANITSTATWKSNRCTITINNQTKADGPLTCLYLGTPYTSSDFVATCNIGTPIQVDGIPIPNGGCNLVRSETVSR